MRAVPSSSDTIDGEAARSRARAFFTRHAAHYGASRGHRSGEDLDRLMAFLDARPGERALDVATGGGHTAFRLARLGADVIGLDLTPAMRQPFEQTAAELGLHNVRFQVGDVERLPFCDGSFDIVSSRRAPHHFPDIRAALREMVRILRPGGRLGIADMSAPEEEAADRLFNDLEAARDSSHVRAYTPARWRALLREAGLEVTGFQALTATLPWAEWLAPVRPDGPESARIEQILEAADPRTASRIVTYLPDGRLFTKSWVVAVARKP